MFNIKSLVLGFVAVFFSSFAAALVLDRVTGSAENLKVTPRSESDFSRSEIFDIYNSAAFMNAAGSSIWGSALVDAPDSVVAADFNTANNPAIFVAQISADKVEIYIDVNFSGANRKELSGSQNFAMDEVNFNKRKSNVSDPSSFFLLGVGIVALAVARHKSAASKVVGHKKEAHKEPGTDYLPLF